MDFFRKNMQVEIKYKVPNDLRCELLGKIRKIIEDNGGRHLYDAFLDIEDVDNKERKFEVVFVGGDKEKIVKEMNELDFVDIYDIK